MDYPHLDEILSALEEIAENGSLHNPDLMVSRMCEMVDLPKGDKEIASILAHPHVMRTFADSKYAQQIIQQGDPAESKKFLQLIRPKLQSEELIRIRRFRSIGGRYPAQEFRNEPGIYGLIDFEPLLITRYPSEWQKEDFAAELGSLTRGEIKLLATLMFSLFAGGPYLYFQFSDHVYDLPNKLILGDESSVSSISLRRAKTVLQILDRIKPPSQGWFQLTHDPAGRYEFSGNEHVTDRLEKLNSAFELTNDLALRTAFLMIRAASLWTTGGSVFRENALADLLFGLEGCLHLVHQRFDPGANFEIQPTFDHIEAIFPHFPGYVPILQDAYDKRIQIVHPENRVDSSWIPNLWAEDFYDNFGLGTDLFYYALTGDILPESP